MVDHETPPLDPSQNTRDWIENSIKSLRSEMRLLFVVAVAGNGILSHLSFGTTVGYVYNGGLLGLAGVLKIVSLAR